MMWPFESDQKAYAIIDAALPQLRERCYARLGAGNSEPLYLNTPLAHLIDVSPVLVEIEPESRFLEWIEGNRPTLNWGVLLASNESLSAVATHLRKSLTVKDTDDDEVILRFYDPDILPVLWDALSTTEQHLFCGPVMQWAARDPENSGDWWHATRTINGPEVESNLLTQPWLKLTTDHKARLRPLSHRPLRAQVITTLNKTITWRLMHLTPAFVESRIEESLHALYRWLPDPEASHAVRFCRLRIEHCSHFYQSKQAQTDLENMAFEQAMERLEQAIAATPELYADYHDPEWMPEFNETALADKRRQQRWSDQG